jgi:hypothetical protein
VVNRRRFFQTVLLAVVILGIAFVLVGRVSAETSEQLFEPLPLPFVKSCGTTQSAYWDAASAFNTAYNRKPRDAEGMQDAQNDMQDAIAWARAHDCDWPEEEHPDSVT